MLHINENSRKIMVDDAVSAYPDECCGFILGNDEGEHRLVNRVLVVNNSKHGDKRRRFEISPRDYLRAERFAEETNLQLLGVYHSHPDHPAKPSETDRKAAQPNFSYIIISVMNGKIRDVRSWHLGGNELLQESGSHFEEETILNLPDALESSM